MTGKTLLILCKYKNKKQDWVTYLRLRYQSGAHMEWKNHTIFNHQKQLKNKYHMID